VNAARRAGIKTTSDVITQMILHPDLIPLLRQRVAVTGRVPLAMQTKVAAALMVAANSDQSDHRKSQ
jgi:hypothetical protein